VTLEQRDAVRFCWGPTRRLPPDVRDEHGTPHVVVYAVRGLMAAAAYAAAEREVFGNLAREELRESVGWCVVVDLRPQIARVLGERAAP
jgi:hypothetical protein